MDAAKHRKDILEALSSFQKTGALTIDVLSSTTDTLSNESDRGSVVIVGSLTEDLLADCLLKKFASLSDAQKKALFKPGGLLNSWADKTSMARALGMIGDDDVERLEVITKMRNACAHSRKHIDFLTPQLKAALTLLYPEQERTYILASEQGLVLRAMFIIAASYLWRRIRGAPREESSAACQAILDKLRGQISQQQPSPQKLTIQLKRGDHPAPKGKARSRPPKSSRP